MAEIKRLASKTDALAITAGFAKAIQINRGHEGCDGAGELCTNPQCDKIRILFS